MRARLKPDGVRNENAQGGEGKALKEGVGVCQDKPCPPPPPWASEALTEVRAASA